MATPKLGDVVLYEPPEGHAIRNAIVGIVVRVEQLNGAGDENSYKLSLWCLPTAKDAPSHWATPSEYSKRPKPDCWRWTTDLDAE